MDARELDTRATSREAAFRLGILMLDTGFPRFSGEVGHPETFPFPVDFEVVPGARVGRVVQDAALPEDLAAAFFTGAQRLAQRGATLITTSCGFLAPLQDRLAEASGCAVMTSSLVLLPLLRSLYGHDALLAILTFDAGQLGARHLPHDIGRLAIGGLDSGTHLRAAIAEDKAELDPIAAQREIVERAERLCLEGTGPAALLLECTNLSPYKPALRAALGLPVYDLVDAIFWQARAAGWTAR